MHGVWGLSNITKNEVISNLKLKNNLYIIILSLAEKMFINLQFLNKDIFLFEYFTLNIKQYLWSKELLT